jgi:gliding motility-associated-like protein
MRKRCIARFFAAFLFFCCSFTAGAQVVVTATAGTPGPTTYTTLKGAFDAINAGTHRGVIIASINANTTETAVAALNGSGSGSANYTSVVVKPGTGATPTVSGSLSGGPIVKLNGSNNVTIDGSNNGTTSRNLTITNTSTSGTNVLLVGSVGTTPINNVIVKNSILINGTNSSTAMILGDAGTAGNPGYFSNITIQNNDIRKAYIGLYIYAVVSALTNNVTVTGNDLNAAGANAIRLVGVYVQGAKGITISNNNIGNFEAASAEFDRAIWLATATTNATISGNTISGLAYTGTSSYAPIGLNISSGVTNSNIAVTGNTVSGLTSSGTGTTMGMFIYSAMSGVTVNKNIVNNIRNTNTTGYGSAGILLATTINTSAIKVNNNFVSDVASYGFNDYTSTDNGNGIVVDGGGGFDIDFNTVSLTANQTLTGGHRASCLLITDNVTAAGAVNIRNNIFANLQTVGNANSRLAISRLSAANTIGTMNYNDFYSTSGNLSSTGTNASITNTIAQLRTSLGANVNSVNIQPVFVSASDLHLDPSNNAALNNLGSPLAGITTDIDGDTRSATTPDMGADEFVPCPLITVNPQPVPAAICLGRDTSFIIAATNAAGYQWQVNTGSGFNDITNNAIYSGATTVNLHLTNPPATYSGYLYRCKVLGAGACSPVFSNAVALTINALPVATITPASSTTFCAGGSVTLNAPAGFAYQWQVGNVNIAPPALGASYNAITTGSYTVIVTNSATTCSSTSAPTIVTVNPLINAVENLTICANQLPYTWHGQTIAAAGNAAATYTTPSLVTGCDSTTTLNLATTPALIPSVSIAITAGNQISCTGLPAGFTATPINGGTSPSYQWQINGVNAPGAVSSTFSYTPGNNNIVTCVLTAGGGCFSSATATSPGITMTVNPVVVPAVSIAVTTGSATMCAGSSITFTATPTNGGAAPGYQWQINGTNAPGATASTFTTTTLANNDVVSCVLTGNAACASPAAATSNTITIIITTNVAPSVSIAVTAGNQTMCAGSSITFTAAPTNGGTSPAYQWQINNINAAGATGVTFTTIALANNDVVTCVVTSNLGCVSTPTATSTGITVTVNPLVAPAVNIAITTGNQISCAGSAATFTATPTNGGAAPAYQWQVNGINASGATNSTYTYTPVNNDVVTCILTSNAGCVSPATATSTGITMTVNPNLPPSVSIAITSGSQATCAGSSVTFTATPTNGGTAPAYQWQVNGSNTATGNTFTSTTLANNDIVTCILTSNAGCVLPATATSTGITMTVNPILTPSVSIAVTAGSQIICAGSSVTFTATPTNGGTTPAYQWQVNGSNATTGNTFTSTTLANGDVITCVLTSSEGCVSSATAVSTGITMTVNPLLTPSVTITQSPAGAVCAGTIVTFTAAPVNGGTSPIYQWKVNGIAAGTNNAVFSYASQAGDVVTCTLTSNETCLASNNPVSNAIGPVVNPMLTPTVTITSPVSTICTGGPLTFTATPANGGTSPIFQWMINGVNVSATGNIYPATSLQNNDNVTVLLTSNEACVTSATALSNNIHVTVAPTPVITLGPDQTILQGGIAQLTSSSSEPVNNYSWSPAGSLSNPSIPDPVASPLSTTTYRLDATSLLGCPSFATVVVSVVPGPVIANTFTPNNDGMHDTWTINNLSSYPKCRVQVFSRTGQMVFESIGYSKPWDGTFKGKPLPIDTYYYVIELNNLINSKPVTGYVTILK